MNTPYSPHDPGQQQAGMPGAYPPQGGYGYTPGAPRGYLQGGPVGFGDAVKLALRNIFTYQGRASRSAYRWFALFSVIVLIVAAILIAVLKSFGQVIVSSPILASS